MFTSLDRRNKPLSVLYLSNDHFNGAALKVILEDIGHMDVVTTISAGDALSHFTRRNFDLFITDLGLDGVDGLELIRQIRHNETSAPRDVTILALATNDDFKVTNCRLADLGINGIVMTPFTLKTLVDQIAEALSHHHLAQVVHPDSLHQAQTEVDHIEISNSRYPERIFTLPFGALGEGMYLVQAVTVKGSVLIPAGTCLDENHLMLIEQMEDLLDGEEVLLSSTPPLIYDAVEMPETERPTPILAMSVLESPKVEPSEHEGVRLRFAFG